MATRKVYEIPTRPKAQSFFIRLGPTRYCLTLRFNSEAQAWMLDIADSGRIPILSSLPIVTGLDVLAMHRHVGIPGAIVVQTDHDPDAVPTYADLGSAGRIYFVVTTA